MPDKMLLFFVTGLLQFAVIYSEWSSDDLDVQRRIQAEASTYLDKRRDLIWKGSLPNENIQFIPLPMEVSMCVGELKYFYYDKKDIPPFNKEKYLQLVCAPLFNITDAWQKSSNVKFRLNNAIFYDKQDTPQQLLEEMKTYLHADLYSVSFDPFIKQSLLATVEDYAYEWIAKHTREQGYKLNNPINNAKGFLLFSLLSFTACWDTPKSTTNSPQKLYVRANNNAMEVPAFNSKETIGYYNNRQMRYEAIRLPFKNNEFSMIILLPYENNRLNSIRRFSIDQYLNLFGNVSRYNINIEYVIPKLNLPTFSLNECGVSINGDPAVCDSSSAQQTSTNKKYKPIYADRQFGILIYDEENRYILVHAWVKNPIASFSNPDDQMQWNLVAMNY